MHYVTRRSHRMQKHKFGVMCPDALFVESIQTHVGMKIVRRTFAPQTHQNALCDPQIPPNAKTHVRCNVSVIPDFASKTKYSSHVCPGSFIPHTPT
jgi:hypothetical protein